MSASLIEKDAFLAARMADAMLAEAETIRLFAQQNMDRCLDAVHLIHASNGPLVTTGIGKSGHIARKIASTFSSLGKPAMFMHAAEASHGDLGLVQPGSVVLALSNSGETTELSDLLHYCSLYDIKIIAITASHTSTLARAADYTIAYGEVREVCPNGLAPTTSTTLTLAIGDALAIGVSVLLGTAPDDFRKYHPGGKLGLRLLRTSQLMRTGDALPFVSPDAEMSDVVVTISEKALGVAILSDRERKVIGVITDGDMRRHAKELWSSRAIDVATKTPITINRNLLAHDAAAFMSEKGITVCLVTDDENRVEGVLSIHDCLRAGVAGV
ncbi:MAG: KpsF/GutQ family sugar-phosphate isomerase [Pseudomonadota bacterium]